MSDFWVYPVSETSVPRVMDESSAQANRPHRDMTARLKLLGGLLRLDGLQPQGFTAQELATYAEVEAETARAFLSSCKGAWVR